MSKRTEMRKVKPIGVVEQNHMTEVSFFADTDFGTKIPRGTELYALPDTHRIVPVELLEKLVGSIYTRYDMRINLQAIIDKETK